MTFNFRRAEVQPSPAYPFGVIYRPKIPIWIGAEDGLRKPYFGLPDTGSDDTKLPLSVAQRLGVRLDHDHPVMFRGVGGEAVGYYGAVSLELRQSPKSWLWAARVAFLLDLRDATSEERITAEDRRDIERDLERKLKLVFDTSFITPFISRT